MHKIIFIIFSLIISAGSGTNNNIEPVLHKPEEKIVTNASGKGHSIFLTLFRGKSFYYPLAAVWIEDTSGKYIQTLYVSKTVVTKVFPSSRLENDKWIISPVRATRTLPYWAHKSNVDQPDDPDSEDNQSAVPDAYTGATPTTGFILKTRADDPLPGKFKVMMEINQKWDRNDYWTPNKYPDDMFYKLSYQPALVYEAIVETGTRKKYYPMKLIGHSHYSGNTDELFTDLSTLTTALEIADSVTVRIKNRK